MSGSSTVRAEVGISSGPAGLPATPQSVRRNGRTYLGRALGRSGAPDWLVQSLRLLAFIGAGLILGALILLSVD